MNQFAKTLVFNTLKIAFAFGLITWLLYSGKLDFKQLSVITQSPQNIALSLSIWLFGMVGMSSLRWKILLKGIGLSASYLRAVQLTMIGLFFNSTMPGAVGGDIIKAVYVIREQGSSNKTPAMLTIVLDRIMGLMGLFVMGSIGILFNLKQFLDNPKLLSLAISTLAVALGTGGFFVLLFKRSSALSRTVESALSWNLPGMGLLGKIYQALRIYKDTPFSLVQALLLSIGNQTIIALFFMHITYEMNGSVVDFSTYASIYPLAILVTALPLAPAGLGVGHVAFDKLYAMVGMANGANVFNVYVLISIALNITGVIPYLLIRKKADIPQAPLTSI